MSENPDNPVLVPNPLGLPPIPDEAWTAANDAHWSASPGDYRPIVRAAWPHLYAAALRHAADDIADWEGHDTGPVAYLRRMADEATP